MNDQDAFSRHFQHGRIPRRRGLLFTPRAKPFLSENQIALALKNFRRRVIVDGERFFQSDGPFPAKPVNA